MEVGSHLARNTGTRMLYHPFLITILYMEVSVTKAWILQILLAGAVSTKNIVIQGAVLSKDLDADAISFHQYHNRIP